VRFGPLVLDSILKFADFFDLKLLFPDPKDPMKKHSITREFGDLIFYSEGSGPALLGLSGFGCSHYNYIDLIPELSKHFQVVLIDNRGMGESSKTERQYSLKDVAADALAAMDFLGYKTFGLMGISMGGFIAQELIKLAPERVKAVSFLCTLSSGPDFISPTALTEAGLRQFATLDPKMQAEFSTMGTVHPSLKEKNPSQYQRIVDLRIAHRADVNEQVRQNNAAVEFLSTPFDLSFISMPTLALSGANDRFVNPENTKAFQKNIKQCQTALIPECDHFFFLEKPKEVSESLVRFFKEVL